MQSGRIAPFAPAAGAGAEVDQQGPPGRSRFLVGGAVIVVPRDVLPMSRQRCQEHEKSGQDHPVWDRVIVAHARAPPDLSVPYILLLSDDAPGELRESHRTVRARRPLTVLSPRST